MYGSAVDRCSGPRFQEITCQVGLLGRGKQTLSAEKLFFRANLLYVPDIKI